VNDQGYICILRCIKYFERDELLKRFCSGPCNGFWQIALLQNFPKVVDTQGDLDISHIESTIAPNF
jgi:hypothetical protein